MSYLPPNSQVLYKDYQASLTDGSEIDSDWLDMSGIDKVQFSGFGSAAGMTVEISSRDDASQTPLVTPVTYNDGAFYMFNIICRQSEMRFKWQNNTGSTVTNVSMLIKGTIGSSDKLSVFPVGVQPSDFSQAALVQAISRGLSPTGAYEAVGVNQVGAILTSDFGTEVSRGLYPGYAIGTKFGRNPDIDIGTPEDMWAGGGTYTGFNATENENIEVFSANAADTGTSVSSGTATGGSTTTLVDSGATFSSDGVAVGDIVLNDTQAEFGYITAVTETQLTVYAMYNGTTGFSSGDTYRVATAGSTGAAVVQLQQLLDEDYAQQADQFVIMNGTTGVTVTGNFMRCTRAKVLLAGSGGLNAGIITVRQATTTANVFAQMPVTGQTTIAAYTVPAGKTMLIKRIRASITRANGSAGSATIILFYRTRSGAWNGIRVFELQTGAPTEFTSEGALVIPEGSDVKYRISNVSDNNTVAEGAFEYYLVDNI